MRILLFGATGRIGSRILDEALRRGHAVTAAARHVDRLEARERLQAVAADASDADTAARLAEGHDAVVAALSPRGEGGRATYMDAMRALLAAGAPRVLLVGGAGSLEVAPGTQFVDTPDFPEEYKPESLAAREALALARASDANWTVLCPPIVIEPGERTGDYRVGGTRLLTGDDGPSRISMEDFAVALVDELETPRHERAQFTVAD